jgi:hypothetical protein
MVQDVRGINPDRELFGFADPESFLYVGVETECSPRSSAVFRASKLSRFWIYQKIDDG